MSKNIAKKDGISRPIRVEGYEGVPIIFTNYIFVSHTVDEFILTFAQVHTPYLVSPTEREIAKIEYIPASVISRVALTPNKMKELIDTLRKNYQTHTKLKEGK